MRQSSTQARLSDEILLVHPSIMKVLVLQEGADRIDVVEKASRSDFGKETDEVDESLESGSLNPAKILGDAGDLNLGIPKLVGVVYSGELLVFARISSYRVLAVRAEASTMPEVLQSLDMALPRLADGPGMSSRSVHRAKSAADITETAQNYVRAIVRSADVAIDKVALDQAERIWEIHGSYRTIPLSRSRRFELQLGTEKEVIGFASIPQQSLAPLLTGTCVILGTLLFLIWFLFLSG